MFSKGFCIMTGYTSQSVNQTRSPRSKYSSGQSGFLFEEVQVMEAAGNFL